MAERRQAIGHPPLLTAATVADSPREACMSLAERQLQGMRNVSGIFGKLLKTAGNG
jgi:hypothetical protein